MQGCVRSYVLSPVAFVQQTTECLRKQPQQKQTSELLAKIHTHMNNVRILNLVENLCVKAVCVEDLFLQI